MEARKKFQVQRGRSIKSFDKIVPILWRFTRYFGKWVRMYALFHPITFFNFSRINLSICLLNLLIESHFFSFRKFFDAFFSEEQPFRKEYTFACCLYCIFPVKEKPNVPQVYFRLTKPVGTHVQAYESTFDQINRCVNSVSWHSERSANFFGIRRTGSRFVDRAEDLVAVGFIDVGGWLKP